MSLSRLIGSSNPPTLPYNYPPSSKEIIKALWSIRNLSNDTQKTYAKMLKRLQRETDLRDPEKVERWVFDLKCSNKTRSIFFDAYRHYCIAKSTN